VTSRAQLTALVFIVIAALFVGGLVRRGGLRSKYTLLWLAVASVLAPLAVFPGLLSVYSDLVGVHYPPTALLLTAVVILIFVAVHFSWELSRTETRVRRLAEEVALLLDATARGQAPAQDAVGPGAARSKPRRS
jgi:hypothetical protein